MKKVKTWIITIAFIILLGLLISFIGQYSLIYMMNNGHINISRLVNLIILYEITRYVFMDLYDRLVVIIKNLKKKGSKYARRVRRKN